MAHDDKRKALVSTVDLLDRVYVPDGVAERDVFEQEGRFFMRLDGYGGVLIENV